MLVPASGEFWELDDAVVIAFAKVGKQLSKNVISKHKKRLLTFHLLSTFQIIHFLFSNNYIFPSPGAQARGEGKINIASRGRKLRDPASRDGT